MQRTQKNHCWRWSNSATAIQHHNITTTHLSLAYFEHTGTDNSRVAARKAGAIEAIVKIMNTHTDNADVCRKGFGALWSITVNGKQSNACSNTSEHYAKNQQMRTKRRQGVLEPSRRL